MSEFTSFVLFLTAATHLGPLQEAASDAFGRSVILPFGLESQQGLDLQWFDGPQSDLDIMAAEFWTAMTKPRFVEVLTPNEVSEIALPPGAFAVLEGEDFRSWVLFLPEGVAPRQRYLFLGQKAANPDQVGYSFWTQDYTAAGGSKQSTLTVIAHPDISEENWNRLMGGMPREIAGTALDWAASLPEADLAAISEYMGLEKETARPLLVYGGLRDLLPALGRPYQQMLSNDIVDWAELPGDSDVRFFWELEEINY